MPKANSTDRNGFVIDKKVPLPKRGVGLSEALRNMGVGDSVVAPVNTRQNWYSCAESLGIKVSIRKVSDEQLRIWRVK